LEILCRVSHCSALGKALNIFFVNSLWETSQK
jgi:hypothetical protein